MSKVLITGVSGFAGSFLAEKLITEGKFQVYGIYINEAGLVNLASVKDKINLIKLDLLDEKATFEAIQNVRPDYIYHLAGMAVSGESFNSPRETLIGNITPQINIFEAVRKLNLLQIRILVTSSAEVYGKVDKKDLPIDEDAPFRPTNPYAVSKLTQDFLGLQYFLSYGLEVIRVRAFNHIGPRQIEKFVVGSFAKKIAEIEKGKREPILPVGNLETKRDFTDVRDMVNAYVLAIEKGVSGEAYNIGSGKSYSISDILDRLLSLSTSKIEIKQDKSLFRPSDDPELLCDNSKFSNIAGWKPDIPIDKTLKDTLDYWRNII